MVLTKRQHQVFSFLQSFIEKEGYCPSYEEIAAGLHLSSLATVHAHLAMLEKKGYLRRGFNQSRSIELRKPAVKRGEPRPPASSPAALPLLGRIAAGLPVEAIEGHDEVSLADITGNRAAFVLEVRGNSMIDDHILDGDYVMVERREQAEDGQIVVALVDGVEATLKRIYREKGGIIRLQPANAAMPPIRVPAERVQIQGRVLGVLRKC
ncbi:MAG TPA: transcriptional repressor LexA [Terriglobales bacterium]|nr:transcriptional repressor LexA [Terriglobales bacterium]